jgi:CheY-like chemotaxis protein
MNELVLVVDDEPKSAKLAKDYLENGGFQVVTVGDGYSGDSVCAPRHGRSGP